MQWRGSFAFPFSPKLRLCLALALILLLVAEASNALHHLLLFPRHAIDFAQHYFLGWFINAGGSLTDTDWPRKVGVLWQPWSYEIIPYLPYQAFLILPMRLLARLPFVPAYLIWIAAAAGLWIIACVHIGRLTGWPTGKVLMLVTLWPTAWLVFLLGNVDIFTSALLTIGMGLLLAGREVAGGFLFGVVSVFKPPFVLGLVPWLRRRPRTIAASVVAAWLTMGLWALLNAGPDGVLFFVRHFQTFSTNELRLLTPTNGSLVGLWGFIAGRTTFLGFWGVEHIPFHGLLPGALPVLPMAILSSVILVGWGLWEARNLQEPVLEAGFWLTAGALVSPVSWPNHNLYLALPLLYLWATLSRRPPAVQRAFWLILPFILLVNGWSALIIPAAPFMPAAAGQALFRLALAVLFIRAARSR